MEQFNKAILTIAVSGGLLFFIQPRATAGIFDDVELKSLPPAVQKTINAQIAGAKLRKIERETENGSAYYEVDITKDGKRMEFKVDEAGTMLTQPMTTAQRVEQKLRNNLTDKIGNDVTLEQLPPAVQAAVKKETAGGQITEIEQDKEDALTFYEVEFERGGDDREITLDQTGKVVKRDD